MLTERDKEVIAFVEQFQIVTKDQLKKQFFPSKWGESVMNKRLQEIMHHTKIKRTRSNKTGQTLFYIAGRIERPEHELRIVDFYQWLEKDFTFRREVQINFTSTSDHSLRADGLVTMGRSCFFVEIDNDTESKKAIADKYMTYRDCRLSEGHQYEPWVIRDSEGLPIFPAVVIVVYSGKRLEELNKVIAVCEKDCRESDKLRIRVALWDQLQKEKGLAWLFLGKQAVTPKPPKTPEPKQPQGVFRGR